MSDEENIDWPDDVHDRCEYVVVYCKECEERSFLSYNEIADLSGRGCPKCGSSHIGYRQWSEETKHIPEEEQSHGGCAQYKIW